MKERFLYQLFRSESGALWCYDAASNRLMRFKGLKGARLNEPDLVRRLIRGDYILPIPDDGRARFRTDISGYRRMRDGLCGRLTLEVTQACNLRCSYCIYSGKFPGWREHGRGHMSREVAERAIDSFCRLSRRRAQAAVCFYGGEALLYPDMLRSLVEAARERSRGEVYFHIGTNGTLLNDEIMDWLAITENVYLDVTYNGSLHDRYRTFLDGKPSRHRVEENLVRFQARYPQVVAKRVNYICNGGTWRELETLRDDYQERGIVPSIVTSIEFPADDPLFPPADEEDEQAFRRLKRRYLESDDPFLAVLFDAPMLRIHNRMNQLLDEEIVLEGACLPGLTSLFVTQQGDYRLCEKCAGPEFGNVFTGIDWDRIEAMMRGYADVLSRRCADCWARRLCTVCFRDVPKGCQGPVDATCRAMRRQVRDDLALYASIIEEAPARLEQFDQAVAASIDVLDAPPPDYPMEERLIR